MNANKRAKRVRQVLRNQDNSRLRLCVTRSNLNISVQVIDDSKGYTVAHASTSKDSKGTGLEKARIVGIQIAQKALEAGIKKVKFDRGSNPYHGRIASLADGAREGGLEF